MGEGMAVSMAAMMAVSAAPFFLAYGRDTRRPAAIAAVIAVYLAVWGALGFALGTLMDQVMLPHSLPAGAIAVVAALAYAATPWGRWARERCRQMAIREPRGLELRDAIGEALQYTACCVICSAGVMLALVVIGMSSPLVITAGAAVMLAYKLSPWPWPAAAAERARGRA